MMKCSRIILTFLGIMCALSTHSQDIQTVEYEDSYNIGGTCFNPIDIAIGKRIPRRAMQKRGKFDYNLPENLPDSLKMAVETAIDVWCDYMPDVYCKLNFEFVSLGTDIKTSVNYQNSQANQSVFYPLCLRRKLFGESINAGSYDGTIKINSSTDWCIGISETSIDKKNLTYAVMRAIAQVMGFGASLKKPAHYVYFGQSSGHSVTDALIFDEYGVCLKDIPNLGRSNNPQLNDFVQDTSRNIYIHQHDSAHILYVTNPFDESYSLRYLKNPNSIMHYDDSQVLDLKLDVVTIDILKAIGWDIETHDLEIIGENIDSTGITAANQSHRFYLNTTETSISNHHWEFQLPLLDGTTQIVKTATSVDFTIPLLQNPENYKTTIDGIIYGKIIYSGVKEGEDVSAEYTLGLRIKPKIKNAWIVSIIPNSTYGDTFDVVIGVQYEGCYQLTLFAEEVGTPGQYAYYTHIPYFANVTLSQLELWDDTNVDIWAQNSYGSDHYYLTIPADGLLSSFQPTMVEKESIESSLEKPQVVESTFTYDSFNFECLEFNSKSTFKVRCPGADYMFCQTYWEGEDYPDNVYISTKTDDDVFEYECDMWQWGTWFRFMGVTTDGECSEWSDAIHAKDNVTITDSAIADALGITSIGSARNPIDITFSDESIYANFPMADVISMTLTTLSGAKIKEVINNSHLSTRDLPQGIYILTITGKEKIQVTKKIIL